MSENTKPDFSELFNDSAQLFAKAQEQTSGWMSSMIPAADFSEAMSHGTKRMAEYFDFDAVDSKPRGGHPPYFDSVFGVDRKFGTFVEAGNNLLSANTEYQWLIGKTWLEAWQGYASTYGGAGDGMNARSNSGSEPPKAASMHEMVDQWFSYANDALLQCQRTQEFLDAQKNVVKALTEFRTRHRDMVEVFQEQNHTPTRTEVDDLSRSVYELKRELRVLKKESNKTI